MAKGTSKKKTAKKKASKKRVVQPAGQATERRPTAKTRKSRPKSQVKGRKHAAKKKTAVRTSPPPGYVTAGDGKLLVPLSSAKPVPPTKIRGGIAKAKDELTMLMQDLSSLTDGFDISEIELAVSFSADGKFLGVGVGGATTMTIKFKPS